MTTATVNDIEVENIFEKAICLSLELCRLGTSRKVNVGELKPQANVESSAVRVSKKLLEAEELQAIARADGELRRYLESRTSGPALFRTGVYMLSYEILEEVDAELQKRLKERAEQLVPAFVDVYDRAVEDARVRLGDLFRAEDYDTKEEVEAEFTARYKFFAMAEPAALERVNADIFERERQKAEAQWATVLEASNAALMEEFQGLVDHLVERLQPEPDGKKKRFNATLVENLSEFLTTFKKRNIGNAAELQALVEEAEKAMQGITPQRLRDNRFARTDTAAAFAKIKASVDTLVEKAPRRYKLAD